MFTISISYNFSYISKFSEIWQHILIPKIYISIDSVIMIISYRISPAPVFYNQIICFLLLNCVPNKLDTETCKLFTVDCWQEFARLINTASEHHFWSGKTCWKYYPWGQYGTYYFSTWVILFINNILVYNTCNILCYERDIRSRYLKL